MKRASRWSETGSPDSKALASRITRHFCEAVNGTFCCKLNPSFLANGRVPAIAGKTAQSSRKAEKPDCILALLWPLKVGEINWLNGATLLIATSLVFYARLSLPLTAGMAAISALSTSLILAYQAADLPWPLWSFALALFVLAWIGQFIGHKIEGKKPSFFKDLQFLLIGPAWLLNSVYRRLMG
jgi:uncharacterized membrane protein YfcA